MSPEVLAEPFQHLIKELISFIPRLVVALIAFLATLYLSRFVARGLGAALKKRNVDPEISLLLSRTGQWGVISCGTVWSLSIVNFDITGFVAGLGILGFTLGFALKDIAENFVAGILLLLQQPFDIGDAIAVAGETGVVTDIQVRATTLRSFEGLLVIVPNSKVYTGTITNYSKAKRRRLSLDVGVGYGTDLPRASEIMLECVNRLPGVESDPAAFVAFKAFGDSSINLSIFFWLNLKEGGYWSTLNAALDGIKVAFEVENIDIPFPIRSIQMVSQSDENEVK